MTKSVLLKKFIHGNIISRTMVDRIDPNLSALPRHAEASDGKMAIRRDEEQPIPKREPKKKNPLLLPQDAYDQAQVGVAALVNFLQDILRTIEQAPVLAADTVITPFSGQEPAPVSTAPAVHNEAASRAAQAYRHMGEAGAPRTFATHTPSAATGLLGTTEVRQVYALLTTLAECERRGITTLTLSRAENFLTALTNAAEAAIK